MAFEYIDKIIVNTKRLRYKDLTYIDLQTIKK